MTKWEYVKVYTKNFYDLDEYGKKGRELVSVTPSGGLSVAADYYLKRPLKEVRDIDQT